MKSKPIRNVLIIQIYIFINLLKNYISQNYKVTSVDPPYIKINENQKTQSILLITLMFDDKHEFNITEKINKEIILKNTEKPTELMLCKAQTNQGDSTKNKIVFELDQQLFWNNTLTYGRYNLSQMDDIDIQYDDTILIYLNYIILKNPIYRYELTYGDPITQVKYQFKNPIYLNYINRIV